MLTGGSFWSRWVDSYNVLSFHEITKVTRSVRPFSRSWLVRITYYRGILSMNWRSVRAFFTWIALFSFVVLQLCAERPNILLIVSEDNGPELGCYGNDYVTTPVLDRLAAEGVRFSQAYVPQAGCSQSRAAFLTGLYPHQNGQIGLATWKFRLYHGETPNLVRALKTAGYRTGIIGKLHVNPASAFPFDVAALSSSNFGRKHLEQYAIEARRFIEESEKPFFLSVNYPDAHRPFLSSVNGVPESPLKGDDVDPLPYMGLDSPQLRQQTADYYNCMNRLDSMVGELLEALEQSGKSDETLVVYLGDHGADLLRGKRTSYEGGVRVPMIFKWPRSFADEFRNRTVDALVSSIDLMPTLLQVAEAPLVSGLAGQSLIPLLENESVKWRRYLFTEYHLHSAHNYYPQRTVRDERYKLIWNLLPGEVNPGFSFTKTKFFEGLSDVIDKAPSEIQRAYRRMRQPAEFELYDLESDPFEFRDLSNSAAHGDVAARLKSRLQAWRRETRDPLLNQANLRRLQSEVNACFKDGEASKGRLELNYPEYFFEAPRIPSE